MTDTIFLLVKVELRTTLPTVEDAITELQKDAVCLITDTANVDIIKSNLIEYHLKRNDHGTQP